MDHTEINGFDPGEDERHLGIGYAGYVASGASRVTLLLSEAGMERARTSEHFRSLLASLGRVAAAHALDDANPLVQAEAMEGALAAAGLQEAATHRAWNEAALYRTSSGDQPYMVKGYYVDGAKLQFSVLEWIGRKLRSDEVAHTAGQPPLRAVAQLALIMAGSRGMIVMDQVPGDDVDVLFLDAAVHHPNSERLPMLKALVAQVRARLTQVLGPVGVGLAGDIDQMGKNLRQQPDGTVVLLDQPAIALPQQRLRAEALVQQLENELLNH